MIKITYFNHADKCLYNPNSLKDQLVECKKNEPCRVSKEVLVYCAITVFGRKYKTY